MIFFDRRKREERRLKKERRKAEQRDYKNKEKRKAMDRREDKERRQPKDRRSDAYHRLPEAKRSTVNNMIESLYHEDALDASDKRQNGRYFCKASEYVHINVAIKGEGGKTLIFDLKVNDCSRGGIGILVTYNKRKFRNNLEVGDVLQDVAFFSPWAVMNLNGTIAHKTKIEKSNYDDCHIIGLKSTDPIENYWPSMH